VHLVYLAKEYKLGKIKYSNEIVQLTYFPQINIYYSISYYTFQLTNLYKCYFPAGQHMLSATFQLDNIC